MNTEERMARLEERLAWQEDLLETLNQQVAQMALQEDLLQQQLRYLYREIQQMQGANPSSVAAEIPPHY